MTLAALAAGMTLVACIAAPAKKSSASDGNQYSGDYSQTDPNDPLPEIVNDDSGAFGVSARPKDGGTDSAPVDGGPSSACSGGALAPGDLAIVEIMIDSRSGSGDSGEWVEVQNTRNCRLTITGVTVSSPRGTTATSTPDSATVTGDIQLEPGGTFVVADSTDMAKNHGLKGTVFSWNATDVLKNDGDTLTVKQGSVVIDAITYPDLSNLYPGRSFAFPSDCALGDRSDWTRWSLTFTSFATGFTGTPNAPNADVSCF